MLLGHIVFRKLAGSNFPFIGIISPLYPRQYSSFECIPLFQQFTNAFRISTLDGG